MNRTFNQRELAEFYSAADVILNPTYNKTFPTLNLEALSCGTPVLTYRTGGSPEAVTPETGWVVEQGNIENVISIIKGLSIMSEEEISLRRKACRISAELVFDKNACFKKYMDLYESLLGNNKVR